jgi:hypothetical protein
MELAHDLADYSRALYITLFGTKAHLGHLVDDSSLDGLESIASVGESARIDYGIGILEE